MRCEDFDASIQAYLDGELAPELAERVRAHASGCDRCADELRRAAEELAALVGGFVPEDTAERLPGRVMAELAAGSRLRTATVASFPLRWRAVAAAVAGIAAAVAWFVVLRDGAPRAAGLPLAPRSAVRPAACDDPCAIPVSTSVCALPEANCDLEVVPAGESRHCRLALAACATRFAPTAMDEFEVSGSGRAEVWVFPPGEASRDLPPHVSAMRAASGAQGIVFVREGRVRVENPSGAADCGRTCEGILLFAGRAPQPF